MPKKNDLIPIVLTGGHAGATAYSVIQELRERREITWDIYWVGSKKALEGKRMKTLEQKVFPTIGVHFLPLFSGRVQTRFTFWTIPALIKIPFGFLHSFYYLLKVKPRVVVSFGGFIAVPVVIASWILRIPIIIHEQTAAAGRANEISSIFAKKIALARPESLDFFPKEKSYVIGNPISKEIRSVRVKRNLDIPPTLLITGGSRGSVVINSAVEEILEILLKGFRVIHQTGEYQFEKYTEEKLRLPKNLAQNYEVYSLIMPWEWSGFIKKADIVISRAGANVVSELIFAKRPSILIPLAIAYKEEQLENAKLAKKFGIAEIIKEENLTGKLLLDTIYSIKTNWVSIIRKVENKESPDTFASKKFVDLIEEMVS